MSKLMRFFLVVFLASIFLVANVMNVFAKRENLITLISASFIPGKGIVYVFDVDGKQDGFKGIARFGNHEFRLICNFRDDGALSCTMNQGGAKYIGQTAQIILDGFAFNTIVYPPPAEYYCSNVYDLNPDWPGYGVGDGSETYWVFAGEYCREAPFNYRDQISYNENLYYYLPDDFIYGWTGESYGDGLFELPQWW